MNRKDILSHKKEILEWIENFKSKAWICKKLACKPETLNKYLKIMNIKYSGNQGRKNMQHLETQKDINIYLKKDGVFITSHALKKKLISSGLKKHQCEKCKRSKWNGKPIPLELHHIDGNHFNNDLSNLELLCPNCHAQEPNNSGATNKNQ